MLQRVASLVKPVMRKHGWVLPVLSEFFPDEPNLVGLNVNGGEKILLRLRPPWAPDTFYDIEQVVSVMLHELTHNVRGPHDEEFYRILGSLEDEYAALKRSGYAGEGFFSKGRRLGENVSHNVPPGLARIRALEAAEKRKRMSAILSGSIKLGGHSVGAPNLSPRELAARAAERRRQDDKSCGSVANINVRNITQQAAEQSVIHEVIDLTLDGEDNEGGSSSSASRSQNEIDATRMRPGISTSNPGLGNRSALPSSSSQKPDRAGDIPIPWICPTCTLENESFSLQCDACLGQRPLVSDATSTDGWICSICGEEMENMYWSCGFCGTIKSSS